MAKEKKLNPSSSSSSGKTTVSAGERAFKGVADLIKLLPSGTVFAFQFLSPLLTNSGNCAVFNEVLTGVLIAACGFSCCFSSFTDSYLDADGKVYYGVATAKGMWLFSGPDSSSPTDLSKYRLRVGDFVHAALSLLVFAVIALSDSNTASCFYAPFASQQKTLLTVLPTVVGFLASAVFMVFPNKRHGIGYAPTPASSSDNSD